MRSGKARIGLPEIGAFEEFKARALEVDGFEAVDEAEQCRMLRAEMFAQFLDEGENRRPDHDVIDDFGVGRDLREVAGERTLGRRNGDERVDFAALGLDRRREIIAVVVAEGEVREDHADLLADILGDPRGKRDHLRFHIGDARLEGVAVEAARGHVMAFGHHVIGNLQFAGAWRRAHDHMAEQRAEGHVALVLGGEFFDHFSTPARVGAVILGDDFHLAAIDAAACSLISAAAAVVVRSYQRP